MALREGRNGTSPWRGTTTALGLLAGAQRGVTEATLLRVHGFTFELLTGLVHNGVRCQ